MFPSLHVSGARCSCVRVDSHALQQLIDLLIAELLTEARQHIAQLADADVTGALLVKHLEPTHELLCRVSGVARSHIPGVPAGLKPFGRLRICRNVGKSTAAINNSVSTA